MNFHAFTFIFYLIFKMYISAVGAFVFCVYFQAAVLILLLPKPADLQDVIALCGQQEVHHVILVTEI